MNSGFLSTETVEGTTAALERVDDVKRSNGFALSVFGVGDRVTNDVLEEDLEDAACLLVNQARDTLNTATACQATNGRLSDTLDVVAQDLAVALGTALSETLSTLSTTRHLEKAK